MGSYRGCVLPLGLVLFQEDSRSSPSRFCAGVTCDRLGALVREVTVYLGGLWRLRNKVVVYLVYVRVRRAGSRWDLLSTRAIWLLAQ